MTPEFGEILTRWTVRLAVACYLSRLFVDIADDGKRRKSVSDRVSRRFWTAGCGLYLLHVVCAFHFFHDWSHRNAYGHTAAQTAEVTGVAWGGGLFFNYAFTLLWTADVIAWWRVGTGHSRYGRGVFWSMHAFFAFMIFNATVVFGPSFWKWIGAAAGAVLLWTCCRSHCRTSRRSESLK